MSCYGSVEIVTRPWAGHLINNWSIHSRNERFISSPMHPVWLWATSSLLFGMYCENFPRSLNGQGAKLPTHCYPVFRLRINGAILPFPHMFYAAQIQLHRYISTMVHEHEGPSIWGYILIIQTTTKAVTWKLLSCKTICTHIPDTMFFF